MSALTEATIIIEASDTSGTLTQARAALYQKGSYLFSKVVSKIRTLLGLRDLKN
jgi:hypothetical protein